MTEKKLWHISVNSLYGCSFLQKIGYGNDGLLKKYSFEGLSFFAAINACSFEFSDPWKIKNWQHFFISEAKSFDILSVLKGTGSTFALSPQIDFIFSKCWYNILWLPLLVPDTIALDKPFRALL